ncbi:hypothetical protein CCACVL1_29089 [Corchorus capsularis]|uniref:Uncharacterized protein n=1 Tax=Corchorus capsularis TaxID=210143 RepID=A0A1R3G3Y0_COCAP|nr:hypothetical protein CCACVL1_29089 [Corchorus capsularis]
MDRLRSSNRVPPQFEAEAQPAGETGRDLSGAQAQEQHQMAVIEEG